MTRRELVLAVLACAQGEPHTPVQVQKVFFLIDRNIPAQVEGPHFEFQPYHYGPFDHQVYDELARLSLDGLIEIIPGKWKTYRLTFEGQIQGEKLLGTLDDNVSDYIHKVSDFVRSLSFTKLVASIYKKYPEMRENSVFQG